MSGNFELELLDTYSLSMAVLILALKFRLHIESCTKVSFSKKHAKIFQLLAFQFDTGTRLLTFVFLC